MKIAIGSDHGGFELKKAILAKYTDAEFLDFGPESADPCDYPDYADDVAEAVARGEADFGVLVCTTGMGVTMAANRFQNVRAALCRDEKTPRSRVPTTGRTSSASARTARSPPPPAASSGRS